MNEHARMMMMKMVENDLDKLTKTVEAMEPESMVGMPAGTVLALTDLVRAYKDSYRESVGEDEIPLGGMAIWTEA